MGKRSVAKTRIKRSNGVNHDKSDQGNQHAPCHIQKLPLEILGCIFQECIQMGDSPWRLTLVSQLWHDVAMAHASLWAYIMVIDQHVDEESWNARGIAEPVYTGAQYQFCVEQWELEGALERSKRTPLNVRMGGFSTPASMVLVLALLFTPETADRIESLDVFLQSEDEDTVTMLGLVLGSAPLSGLRQLLIHQFTHPRWQLDLMRNALVHSKRIEVIQADITKAYSVSPKTFWESLRTLQAHPVSGTPHLLDQIIPQCRSLERLDVVWPNIGAESKHFATVTNMSLECDPARLSQLSFPNLELLVLYVPFIGDLTAFHSTTLPNLQAFRVCSSDIGWLAHFKMPVLQNLSIITELSPDVVSSNSDATLVIFKGPSALTGQHIGHYFATAPLSSVRYLSITSRCDESEYIQAIEAVPNVQVLRCEQLGKGREQFGQKILSRLAESGDAAVCVQLEQLVLGSLSSPLAYGKTKVVRKLINSREMMGRPLSQLDIHFQDGYKGQAKLLECIL